MLADLLKESLVPRKTELPVVQLVHSDLVREHSEVPLRAPVVYSFDLP